MRTQAYIKSLQTGNTHHMAPVEILRREGDHYIALYNGHQCTAIFNFFVGAYFVDDVYGVIDEKGGLGDER